jgi:MOSC domain-containing protein YiiM
MKLLSVNCGLPKELVWHGRSITTSIYKERVQGRIALRTLNLDGDRQSDLTVHGGKDKAVYCYPVEHYKYWEANLPGRALPMGAFGENFTSEGLGEESVCIGDHFAVGSAEVMVSQPRLPCYKLGVRFESDDIVKWFLSSGRTGFYLAVVREGDVGAGDEISILHHHPDSISIFEITRLYIAKQYDEADLLRVRKAIALEALADTWKEVLYQKVKSLG